MTSISLPLRIGMWIFVLLVAAVCLVPVYWLVLSSFRPMSDAGQLALDVSRLSFDNYLAAFASRVPRWLANTFLISVLATTLGLAVAALAGYGFARYEFVGKKVLFGLVLASLALPEFAALLPSFVIMRSIGLLNTVWAVVIPLTANALALFLTRQYFIQLPKELFDAARIDGAGELRTFWSIALPLVRPGLGAAGLILFLSSWNAYLVPLVMLSRTDEYTISLGQALMQSELRLGYVGGDPWGPITAGTVLAILPLIVCLLLMQRSFISGLTNGAVK